MFPIVYLELVNICGILRLPADLEKYNMMDKNMGSAATLLGLEFQLYHIVAL